jgi:hypothetical protein
MYHIKPELEMPLIRRSFLNCHNESVPIFLLSQFLYFLPKNEINSSFGGCVFELLLECHRCQTVWQNE